MQKEYDDANGDVKFTTPIVSLGLTIFMIVGIFRSAKVRWIDEIEGVSSISD